MREARGRPSETLVLRSYRQESGIEIMHTVVFYEKLRAWFKTSHVKSLSSEHYFLIVIKVNALKR